MKIGIIVYSKTGNTYSVVKKLKEKLLTLGHTVNIERIEPVDESQKPYYPNISEYDVLVFGCPVHGASMSQTLSSYLSQITTLKDKRVACLVTEFFPFPWMGGNHAILQMKSSCESKGAVVIGTGVVNWKSLHREKSIEELIAKLSRSI